MGNIDRVNCLIDKGVDVNTTGTPNSPDVLSGTSGLMMAAMSNQVRQYVKLWGQGPWPLGQGKTRTNPETGTSEIWFVEPATVICSGQEMFIPALTGI